MFFHKGTAALMGIGLVLGAAIVPARAQVTSGLSLWLDAGSGVTADGSGLVSSWLDRSGSHHDAGQASTGAQATLVANGLNGQPTLRFNGSSDFYDLSGQILTSQQFTIMAVVTDTRADSGFREVFSNWSGSNTFTSVFFGTRGNAPVRARFSDDYDNVGTILSSSSPFVFTGVSDAADALVLQNQDVIAEKGSALASRDLTTPYRIGSQGTAGEYWQGDIAEVLVYDRALSTSELQANNNYLGQKYGITGAASPEPSAFALLGATLPLWALRVLRRRRIRD